MWGRGQAHPPGPQRVLHRCSQNIAPSSSLISPSRGFKTIESQLSPGARMTAASISHIHAHLDESVGTWRHLLSCHHWIVSALLHYSHESFLHPLHTELVSCPSSPGTWLEGVSPWSLLSHQALVLSRMEKGSVVPATEMNLEQPEAVSLKVHISDFSSSCPHDVMFVDVSPSWGGTHPGSEGHQSMRLCLCICWSLFLEAAGWPAGAVPSFPSTQGVLWTKCHPICL